MSLSSTFDCERCVHCFGSLISRLVYGRPAYPKSAPDSVRNSELAVLTRNVFSRSHTSYGLVSSGTVDKRRKVLDVVEGEVDEQDDSEVVSVVEFDHLVVMVHGLGGCEEDWDVLKKILEGRTEGENLLFYASKVNRKSGTFAGIDVCSQRLSDELGLVLKRHVGLRWISFLCHSMGGLIVRHACGVNFDERNEKIFGLSARHMVTIATPHLGCHVEGESQVPIIKWGRSIPLLGGNVVKSVFNAATSPSITGLCKKSMNQLFLNDGAEGMEPLILKLVQDIPGEGMFFSALKQFRSRICYANTSGDAMVGWANASLRKADELPIEKQSSFKGRGVLMEDAIHEGFWKDADELSACPNNALVDEGPVSDDICEDLGFEVTENLYNVQESANDCDAELFESLTSNLDSSSASWDKHDRQVVVDHMLYRLQSLPWCRIDVAFKSRSVPFMAHTHIQVTRKWIDFVGISVAEHIASRFVELENLVHSCEDH